MARTQLTHREGEVLHLALGGLSNEEIASRLAISRRTVEAHMGALFRKAGVTSRAQLAARYQGSDLAIAEQSGSTRTGASDGPAPPLSQPGRALADCERRLRAYADAVRGLVDRQLPLFEERVEITALIGEQDGQDLVIERRWTTPRPYLVYRILGPIMTWPDGPVELDDFALDCHVAGRDTQVDVHQVLDVGGRPLLMILFQPGLDDETEWMLRYRSPTLWNPLRSSGQDTLSWATATFDERHWSTTSELTVKVVFPASWAGQQLTEDNNLGTVRAERLSGGRTQLTWHQDAPHAGTYHWSLRGSPAS